MARDRASPARTHQPVHGPWFELSTLIICSGGEPMGVGPRLPTLPNGGDLPPAPSWSLAPLGVAGETGAPSVRLVHVAARVAAGASLRSLAREYGVSHETIRRVLTCFSA